MSCERTPVKAPPASRRNIVPPTPQQSSHSSIEAMQWPIEMEDQENGSCEKEFEGQHRWNARDRTVIAKLEQYLKKSDSIKVEIEELKSKSVANPEVCEQEEWQDLQIFQLERAE